MRKSFLIVAIALVPSISFAQQASDEERLGKAYGRAVTKTVLAAETLVLIEEKCVDLRSNMEYRKIVEVDRARVEAAMPSLPQLVAALVPTTVDALLKSDGGCSSTKFIERHKKMQDNFLDDAMSLLQGAWMK